MAKIAYGLYRGKFLNAVSVGFIPVRWENGGPDSAFSRRYLEQELLEVSAVAIPANPNALALGLKSGAVEKADLRDFAELIHQTLDVSGGAVGSVLETSAASADTGVAGAPMNYVRLLALAREVHALLHPR